jgi:hypothetical protein
MTAACVAERGSRVASAVIIETGRSHSTHFRVPPRRQFEPGAGAARRHRRPAVADRKLVCLNRTPRRPGRPSEAFRLVALPDVIDDLELLGVHDK